MTGSQLAKCASMGLALAALTALGCGARGGGSGGDWYYHFRCNGDPQCLATNPTGLPSGDLNEGPVQASCTQLLEFSRRFWSPPAVDWCDQSATGSGGGPAATLASLVVTPATATVPSGRTVRLTATGHYSDGTTQDLTSVAAWSVAGIYYIGDPVVVTVDSTGLVTAASPGTKQVQASYGGLTGSATITVQAPQLAGIAVTPANPTLQVRAQQPFTATATYTDASTVDVTASAAWSSGAPGVVAFGVGLSTTPGLATALAAGTAVISAQYGGQTGSTTVTVQAATLVSITVLPPTPTLAKGATLQLSAQGSYSNGATADLTSQVTWAPANPAVVSLTAGGLATASSVGSSLVSAGLGGVSGSTTLTVGPAALQSVSVSPQGPSVAQGFTRQLVATSHYTDGTTQDVTATAAWSSSVPAVATVSAAGLVSGTALGTAVVTAASGGMSGSTTVTVVALGSTWTAGTSGTASRLNAVAWCAGKFVAVGAAGAVLTSPDGTTWTARTSGTTADLYGVACSGSIVLAAGTAGTLARSADGVTWSAAVPGGTVGTVQGLAWSGAKFLAVGTPGNYLGSAGAYGNAATSVDGTTWTMAAASGSSIWAVASSGTRFVAGGDYAVYASADGATWTVLSTVTQNGVAWSGALFATVGANGSIYTTPDGAAPLYRTSGTAYPLNAVVWSGGQFTAVGNSGTVVTSPDATAWTVRSSGTAANLHGVAWSGARLVAVGDAGTVVAAP